MHEWVLHLPMRGSMHEWVLHFLYSKRSLSQGPGHLPAPLGADLMCFVLFLLPPSQSLEQCDHGPHSVRVQSASHAWVLHGIVLDVSPQGVPPKAIAVVTSRRRCFKPPPHSALHLLQPLHASNLQSIGQGCRLHFAIAVKGNHL